MEKLKILLVARGVLSPQLGTHKVHLELKEEYEKAGHLVDVLDYSNIYGRDENPTDRIIGRMYTYKFWKYLKSHAGKYDVIDANTECIVYPKESFGFRGVLLARSHGIRPIYEQAEKTKGYQAALASEKQRIKFKTCVGNIYRSMQKQPGYKEFWASVKYADIVHCLNATEYNYYLEKEVPKEKLLLVPNGLQDLIINRSNQIKREGISNTAAFVGSWTARKGIMDFSSILSNICTQISLQRFTLLGGHTSPDIVKQAFTVPQQALLEIIPNFNAENLLEYLRRCKIGFFPSYIEGFGLAVVEQLAAGIPVVAYNVPGPDGILQGLDDTLLVAPGDTQGFAEKVISILQLAEADYLLLSERCKQESRKYLLSVVTKQFLEAYYYRLNEYAIIDSTS